MFSEKSPEEVLDLMQRVMKATGKAILPPENHEGVTQENGIAPPPHEVNPAATVNPPADVNMHTTSELEDMVPQPPDT